MKNKVYKAIVDFMLENNYPPTITEISEYSGIKSRMAIMECLEMLELDGKITWERGKNRTIKIPGMNYVYTEK